MFWFWFSFIALILLLLALDLGVFHRKAHVVSVREALMWSAVWISLALCFNVFIYFAYSNHWLGIGLENGVVALDPVDDVPLNGKNAAIKFFTGYVIEKSLSVDNIFVIALIFAFFRIPDLYQHRVLFWGILGALIMRGIFIGLGAALIAQFHWILYIFGGFLIFTGVKMFFSTEDPDPDKSFLVNLVRKYFPITRELHGTHFLVKREDLSPTELATQTTHASKILLTPLAMALIIVEGTDLIFAVDSIPAIFAITGDSFLVFTSNIFAILGLRALYFALAGILHKFVYLKPALALVLALVGVKMLVADYLKQWEFMKNNLSFITLGLIALILAGGVIASLLVAPKQAPAAHPPEPAPPGA